MNEDEIKKVWQKFLGHDPYEKEIKAVLFLLSAYRSALLERSQKLTKKRLDFSQKKYQPTPENDTPVSTKEAIGDVYIQGFNAAVSDFSILIQEE